MDVGLESLPLTRLPSSLTWVEVPYSGDGGSGARDRSVGAVPAPRNQPTFAAASEPSGSVRMIACFPPGSRAAFRDR